MSGVLTLPRLGETMEEGRVVAWLVAPGEAFRRGDALLEVETDKTVVEVPALADGELGEILVPEGETVRVGDPIARLAGTASEAEAEAEVKVEAETEAAPPPEPAATAPAAPADPPKPATPAPPDSAAGARPRATPVARRLARKAGIDLATVTGTGRRGRIESADIAALSPTAASFDAAPQIAHGLAWRLSGPEAGPPVVLIHGFAADHTVWASLAAGLARSGRHVLTLDLPGHGASRTEAGDAAALSTGLSALVKDTLGQSAHIFAHSLGAVPATDLAEAGHARSLTLIAPAGLGHRIDRGFVLGLAAARSPGEIAHLLERMTDGPLPLSAQALEGIAATLARGRLGTLARSVLGETGQAVTLRPRLARLADTLPVRILAPHRDRILDWQDALTLSPRIAVHHLARAGHAAWWDAPQEVLAILAAATAD
ncbi:alpha/beta fold hydrolase [Histidinibacterium lentulum]|uniref:Alpha/beta fold hydrolase n=1 Tax=Histidinibacterium lentulum TaxID=2480588 RepID=A0A3N2R8E2_9RHOB|nr:alpha/beta fold hydrolase [Histidinibacterium lentulum]ROU03651.1 alpha/beta fold hydrolase [Histidinibacterium lentulum]